MSLSVEARITDDGGHCLARCQNQLLGQHLVLVPDSEVNFYAKDNQPVGLGFDSNRIYCRTANRPHQIP